MTRPLVYSLVASVALNSLAAVSFDRAFLYEGRKLEILNKQKLLQAERDRLPFEFIESPPDPHLQKPKKAQKISNRDSVNKDQKQDKSEKNGAPQIDKLGPTDQLAQNKAKPAQKSITARKQRREAIKSRGTDGVGVPRSEKSVMDQKKQASSFAKASERQGTNEPASQDKITTQAMTKAKSRGASLSGATSYDAMGSDMGIYMKNVKERIWMAWFPYLSFQFPRDFQAADAVISFTLDAKGEVKMVKVLDSYGSTLFTTFCAEAIQRASGFGAVPKEILALLGKDELEIRFAFHYR